MDCASQKCPGVLWSAWECLVAGRGWERLGVAGSGWEWLEVAGSGWKWLGVAESG